jgi:hypothetical protein
MRWRVVAEIGIGLLPSTLAFVGGFPVLIGFFLGTLLAQQYGADSADLVFWLGAPVFWGVLALPPLWQLSLARYRGPLPAPPSAFVWARIAIGCALGVIVAAGMWVEQLSPRSELLFFAYLLVAPAALAVREWLIHRERRECSRDSLDGPLHLPHP